MKILSKGTNSIRNNYNKNILIGTENTLGKNNQKNIKVIYEEESDNEPEIEESQYEPEEEKEDIEEEKKETKQSPQKRKKKIFEYMNKDVKRNKR